MGYDDLVRRTMVSDVDSIRSMNLSKSTTTIIVESGNDLTGENSGETVQQEEGEDSDHDVEAGQVEEPAAILPEDEDTGTQNVDESELFQNNENNNDDVVEEDLRSSTQSKCPGTDFEIGSLADSAMSELYVLQIKQPDGTLKQVPGSCAICLCQYVVGDRVVWSKHPACQHVFHEDCMVDWLVNVRSEATCPCCRQEFISMEGVEQPVKERSVREAIRTVMTMLPFVG